MVDQGIVLSHGLGPAIWGFWVQIPAPDTLRACSQHLSPPPHLPSYSFCADLALKGTCKCMFVPYRKTCFSLSEVVSRNSGNDPPPHLQLRYHPILARLAQPWGWGIPPRVGCRGCGFHDPYNDIELSVSHLVSTAVMCAHRGA